MAPITDDTVEALRDTIHKLETRVHQLENKMGGGDGTSKARDGIRMILMGPPGAGTGYLTVCGLAIGAYLLRREGHSSTQAQRQVLRMSSGTSD